MPDSDELLDELRAAAEALRDAEARRLAALRAAFAAGIPRDRIAGAAGMTRHWVYKTLERADDQRAHQ